MFVGGQVIFTYVILLRDSVQRRDINKNVFVTKGLIRMVNNTSGHFTIKVIVAVALSLISSSLFAFSLQSLNGSDFTLNLDPGGPNATAVSATLKRLSPSVQNLNISPNQAQISFTGQPAGHYVFELDYCYNELPEPGPYCDSDVGSLPRVTFDIAASPPPPPPPPPESNSTLVLQSLNGSDFVLGLGPAPVETTSTQLIRLSPNPQTYNLPTSSTTWSFSGQPAGHYVFELNRCFDYQPEPGQFCDSDLGPLPHLEFDITEDQSHIEPSSTIVSSNEATNLQFDYSVNRRGDLSISIPISVPEGINGLAPEIALTFSADKDYLEVDPVEADATKPVSVIDQNWRLSGFPYVRTCNIDEALYCLGSAILVPEETGSQAVPGKTFRLEDNPSIQLETFQEASTGKLYFRMKSGDGTYLFGNTAEGRIRRNDGQDQNDYWFVQHIEDGYGNDLDISYVHGNGNSEIYPHVVDYGGYKVEFGYATKQGVNNYKSSLVVLHTIRSKVNNIIAREVRIGYSTVNASTLGNLSMLDKVQACGYDTNGANPTCTQPLTFTNSVFEFEPNSLYDGIFVAVDSVTDGFGNTTSFVWEGEGSSWLAEFPMPALSYAEQAQSIEPCEFQGTCPIAWQIKSVETSDGIGGINVTEYAYAATAAMNQLVRTILPNGIYLYTKYHADNPYVETTTFSQLLDNRPEEQRLYRDIFTGTATDELLAKREFDWFILGTPTAAPKAAPNSFHSFNEIYLRTLTGLTYENGIEGVVTVEKHMPIKDSSTGLITQLTNETSIGYGLNTDGSIVNVEKTLRATTTFEHDVFNWLVGFRSHLNVQHLNVPGELDKSYDYDFTKENTFSLKLGTATLLANSSLSLTVDYNYDNIVGNLIETVTSGQDIGSRTTSFDNFLDSRYPQSVTQDLSSTGPVFSATANFAYDRRFGAVSQSTDPNNVSTSILRDNFGRVKQVRGPTDNPGASTSLSNTTYSLCGTSCGSVQGVNIVYQILSQSRHEITSLPKGAPDSIVSFDQLGRVIRQEFESFSGEWTKVDTVYDDLGRVFKQSLPYCTGTPSYCNGIPKFVENGYDFRNRLIYQIQPDETPGTNTDNPRIDYSYQNTGSGTIVTVTQKNVSSLDPANPTVRTRQEKYNGLGQLVESIDALGSAGAVKTEYDYDSTGNQDWVRINDDNRTIVTTEFDLAGNATKIIDPSAGQVTFNYDALGQLKTQLDARGIQTTFEYDLAGRLIKRIDDSAGVNPVVNNWTYDTRKVGLLTERKNPGFTENYFYNSKSQLVSVDSDINLPAVARNYDTTFTYDGYGRQESQTFISANQTLLTTYNKYNSYGYSSELRKDALNGQILSRTIDDDNFGNVVESELGGINTKRTYDQYGQISSISTQNGLLQDHAYTWWSNGTLHSRERNFGTHATETFTYDGLDRLIGADTDVGFDTRTLTYAYDDLGNFLCKSELGSCVGTQNQNYTYNSSNPYKLDSATIAGTSFNYTYDNSGNIVSVNTAKTNEDKTITYNAFGKPIDIRKGNISGNSIDTPTAQDQFQYGPDGFRFYKKTINKKIGIVMVGDITVIWPRTTMDQTLYLFGGAVEVVVPAEGTTTAIEKIYLGNVQFINEEKLTSSSSRFEYIHTDHLGSVDVVTNSNGAVVTTNNFDPFGGRRNSDWTSAGQAPSLDFQNAHTNRGFTGHEQLDSTGLIHMNGRVYDPSIGRFMSADPIVQAPSFSQSYNRYAYVFNNPLSFTDPSGYCGVETSEGCSGLNYRDEMCRTDVCFSDNDRYRRGVGVFGFFNLANDLNGSSPPTPDIVFASEIDKRTNGSTVAIDANGGSFMQMGINGPLSVTWQGTVYQIDRDMYDEAVAYIRASIPQQAAMPKGKTTEYFGRLYYSSGKTVDGIAVPGQPNTLCYGGSLQACQQAVKNAAATNQKANQQAKANPPADPLSFNVHLHPGTDKYSMYFSAGDLVLARRVPVFIGNMNGDIAVFVPGMSSSTGAGPILCTGCAR